jgi:hypothetical protein
MLEPMTAVYTSLPLAHLGHWYWVLLFMLPGLLVLAGAIRTAMQERRKARDGRDRKDSD